MTEELMDRNVNAYLAKVCEPEVNLHVSELVFKPPISLGDEPSFSSMSTSQEGRADSSSTVNRASKRKLSSQERRSLSREKHCMLEGCGKDKCSKKCHSKFTEADRKGIHSHFWKQDYDMRRSYLANRVFLKAFERRRVKEEESRKTGSSKVYTFPSNEGETIVVCQKFFLHTLGYKQDQIIKSLCDSLSSSLDGCGLPTLTDRSSGFVGLNPTPMATCIPKDRRGRREPATKKDRTLISNHIESFRPAVSHFRRCCGPNVRYLPSELSALVMFKDFCGEHPEFRCSYQLYRQVIKERNISFNKPCEDKGSTCLCYKKNGIEEAEVSAHRYKEQQEKAHKAYFYDGEKYKSQDDTEIFAVGMQKILLLPRMPDIKESSFLSKMVVFNETFASLKPDKPHFSVIWDESTRGRNASDVTSAYVRIIKDLRDCSHFIFWADSCTAESKNWTLYSTFAFLVNEKSGPQDITMKYLVPRSASFAADELHGKIEQTMRKRKNIYDMRDLVDTIEQSSGRMRVIDLKIEDFSVYKNLKMPNKVKPHKSKIPVETIPHLQSICEAKFEKGLHGMIFKENFEEEGRKISFLKRPLNFSAKKLERPRGIKKSKLEGLQLLISKMPLSRRKFWEELPTNVEADDLLDSSRVDVK